MIKTQSADCHRRGGAGDDENIGEAGRRLRMQALGPGSSQVGSLSLGPLATV